MDIEEAIEMLEYIKNKNTLMGFSIAETETTPNYRGKLATMLLNLIEKQQAELEKKDKVINEMAEYIDQLTNELVSETGDNNLKCCESKECLDNGDLECKDCIIKYYTNKVEREGK